MEDFDDDFTEEDFDDDFTEEDFDDDFTEEGFGDDFTEEGFDDDFSEKDFDDYFTEEGSFLRSQSRGYKSTWCGSPPLRLWLVISDSKVIFRFSEIYQ